jgi:hypothetical protein
MAQVQRAFIVGEIGKVIDNVLPQIIGRLEDLGPKAWELECVTNQLTATFSLNYLDQNRALIDELFAGCVRDRLSTLSKKLFDSPSISQAASSDTRAVVTPPRPPGPGSAAPALPISSSSSQSITDQSRSTTNDPKLRVDEGWIQISNDQVPMLWQWTGAFFSYSEKDTNWVSSDYISHHPQLLPQVVDSRKITMTFFLDSNKHKSYTLDFRIKKNKTFDVLLGKKWDSDMNDKRRRTKRPTKSKLRSFLPLLSPLNFTNMYSSKVAGY